MPTHGGHQPRARSVRRRPLHSVNPSDTAPVMVALDAKFVLNSSKGQRVIGPEEFFIGPNVDITHLTSTRPDEILTAIRIPNTWAGSNFYFEKVTDRARGTSRW
ncbi:MAG: FAD binding domain-containing protein [Bauldia sp.]